MTTADTPLGQAAGRSREAYGIVGSENLYARFTARWTVLLVVADFASIVAATCATHAICLSGVRTFPTRSVLISAALLGVFAIYVFRYLRLYEETTAGPNILEMENLIRAVSLITFSLLVVSVVYEKDWHNAWILLVGSVAALSMLVFERHLCTAALQWARMRGHLVRRALICGTRHGVDVFNRLQGNPRLGFSCVGFLDDQPDSLALGELKSRARVLGTCNDLTEIVCRERIEEIIIADPCMRRDSFVSIMEQCDALRIPVSFVPGQVGPYQPWFSFRLLDGLPWAHRRQAGFTTLGTCVKRALDVLLSLALIVLLAPVFFGIALLVKLGSKGPVFFKQDRVGVGGQLFPLLKFRSMYPDAPKYAHSPTSSKDPRITAIGRVLRRTSLDELPQLFNVLRGEMSLVGPRPEMPFIVANYGPVERGRLRAKPGITGLWQISHARTSPIHEYVDYDLFYIEHQNIFLDLAILISTVAAVVRGTGIY